MTPRVPLAAVLATALAAAPLAAQLRPADSLTTIYRTDVAVPVGGTVVGLGAGPAAAGTGADGWGAAAQLFVGRAVLPHAMLRADLSAATFGVTEAIPSCPADGSCQTHRSNPGHLVHASVSAVAADRRKTALYALAGVGAAYAERTVGDGSTTRFAWHAGAGLAGIPALPRLWLEIRYVQLRGGGGEPASRYVPLLVGFTF